ncbi:serine protease gd-like [Neocloeon triangulifer]|uniref:serine protease gd-like n=1 Tax=Neocloeon triangulifer TaxID=2078957 RepID=UPI00286F3F89|nr:serine protease gd-like [Neocloeon triangulifer]
MNLSILLGCVIFVAADVALASRNGFAFRGGKSYANCGQVSGSVGGRGLHPWNVNIQYSNLPGRNAEKRACTGTLISKRAILTTGYCVRYDGKTLSTDKITVTLGAYDQSDSNERSRQVVKPSSVILHPAYDESSGSGTPNNLALLIFDEPKIQITDFVKPACLWSEDFDVQKIVNATGAVVGWALDSDLKQIEKLLPTQLTVMSNADCTEFYREFQKWVVPTKTLCIAHTNDPGGCAYNDGTGFVISKNGIGFLRAVVRNGLFENDMEKGVTKQYVCEPRKRPLVTDVDFHMDWIVGSVPDISAL